MRNPINFYNKYKISQQIDELKNNIVNVTNAKFTITINNKIISPTLAKIIEKESVDFLILCKEKTLIELNKELEYLHSKLKEYK